MNEAWEWWSKRLTGMPVDAVVDTPQAGFYRMPEKAFYGARKTYTPVAYYPGADGSLRCRLGDQEVNSIRAMELWNRVNQHPVSEQAYREVAENNGLWPDEHPAVPMQGGNQPPEDDSFEGLRERIEDLGREAEERLKGNPIGSQDEADQIANLSDRLAELWKRADRVRKEEKRPHDEECERIQKKWLPVLGLAEAYKSLKYKLLTPWLLRQQEAQKKEAEAAAAAGQPSPSEPRRPRAGTRGRAQTLKTQKRAEIEDYGKALEFFKDSPEVRDAVQALANRAVRAGVTVPGCKVKEESSA